MRDRGSWRGRRRWPRSSWGSPRSGWTCSNGSTSIPRGSSTARRGRGRHGGCRRELDDEPGTQTKHSRSTRCHWWPTIRRRRHAEVHEAARRSTPYPRSRHLRRRGARPPRHRRRPQSAPSAEHLAQLPSMPLFAEVPKSVLAKMVQESRLIDLEPGENLIDRGTTADALYALIEGSVQLIRAADEDAVVLSEGDIVGISCLLDHVNYEGDVTARTKVRALRISRLLLDRLVAEHPALGDVLLEVLGRRLVATLVRTSPMFSSFDNGARSEVAALFEVRRANQGTVILEAGKRADGLYIPMIGELTAIQAERRGGGEPQARARARPALDADPKPIAHDRPSHLRRPGAALVRPALPRAGFRRIRTWSRTSKSSRRRRASRRSRSCQSHAEQSGLEARRGRGAPVDEPSILTLP